MQYYLWGANQHTKTQSQGFFHQIIYKIAVGFLAYCEVTVLKAPISVSDVPVLVPYRILNKFRYLNIDVSLENACLQNTNSKYNQNI